MTLEELPGRWSMPELLTSRGYVGTGVELGVFKGEFSNSILDRWNGNLIGVDAYNKGTDFDIMMNAIRLNEFHILQGRYKIIINDTITAASLVQDELDWVYIDADHSYESVSRDIQAWWPKIRAGGLLCGHDLDKESPGVCRAVTEFASGRPYHHKPCGSWFIEK